MLLRDLHFHNRVQSEETGPPDQIGPRPSPLRQGPPPSDVRRPETQSGENGDHGAQGPAAGHPRPQVRGQVRVLRFHRGKVRRQDQEEGAPVLLRQAAERQGEREEAQSEEVHFQQSH